MIVGQRFISLNKKKMISMVDDRFIDVIITELDENVTIALTQSRFSFTMNFGNFLKASFEEGNVLVLLFDKGEIRIEISLSEIIQQG